MVPRSAAHRDTGNFDAARDLNQEGPRGDRRPCPGRVWIYGRCGGRCRSSWRSPRRGWGVGEAWLHWEDAARIAERLPADYYQPWTSFSRVIMAPHAVTVAVELHQGGESARQAGTAVSAPIPSRPRRGRHLIEVARAHHMQRDHHAVLGTLELAQHTAPETIRYNGYARRMALELTEKGRRNLRAQARELADRIGLMV